MIEWISEWFAARRCRKERRYFSDGYEWAKYVLRVGTYSVPTLRAFADGSFNRDPYLRAFDRGVNAACDERGDS